MVFDERCNEWRPPTKREAVKEKESLYGISGTPFVQEHESQILTLKTLED